MCHCSGAYYQITYYGRVKQSPMVGVPPIGGRACTVLTVRARYGVTGDTMALIEILQQAQGGQVMQNLARQFGVSPAQAEAVLVSVIPEISRKLEAKTLSRGGLSDLIGALGAAQPDRLLDSAAALGDPATKQLGIGFLEQILGTKDQSRAVAGRAARATGVPEGLVKSMLPYIVPMILGALAKQTSGSLGDVLSRLPGLAGGAKGAAPTSARGSSPLSLPDGPPSSWGGGANNPYGGLAEALRKRGARVDGSSLGRTVRDVLGGALGFQSRGIVGWLVRLIVMRWGWTILRTVLGRAIGMR